VEFLPSADHYATLPGGQMAVTRYDFEIYMSGASAPFQTTDMGKPAPQVGGVIRYDFSSQIASWPLPGGVYESHVSAVGPFAISRSGLSNQFTFSGATRCTYWVTPTNLAFGAGGDTATLSMGTGSNCTWSVTGLPSWVTVSPMVGTGSATIAVTVAANTATASRTTTLTVAGQSIVVTQARMPCTYLVSPTGVAIANGGGAASFTVTTQAGCSWTAIPDASWTSVAPTSGSGSATITVTVGANPTSQSRTATAHIAGQNVTVTQAGAAVCTFGVSPTTASVPSGGSTLVITVATTPGCAWTLTSADPWIVLSQVAGSGPGTVTLTVSANTVAQGRTGSATVGGQTITVSQAAAPCEYSVSPASVSLTSDGGARTVTVTTTASCAWSATSGAAWAVLSTPNGIGAGWVTAAIDANTLPRSRSTTLTVAGQTVLVTQARVAAPRASKNDFDGDGHSDVGVFRPIAGTWYELLSSSATATGVVWGTSTDRPVPADYDGDGKTDVAVYRPQTSVWFIVESGTGAAIAAQWGGPGDVPVPADYDGDGKADVAVFRPSSGTWYVVHSSSGTAVGIGWGAAGDIPLPADYDGDGKADPALFRPDSGTWYQLRSASGSAVGVVWGLKGDVPLVADYDGDGKADPTLFRASTGTWFELRSSTGAGLGVPWGSDGDLPIAGDYDGDGRADPSVFRPSTGTWYLMPSSTGTGTAVTWGVAGDWPL
jgi:hypothetical protein